MKKQDAEKIVEYLYREKSFDESEISLYKGYSGRGMFGKETTGIRTAERWLHLDVMAAVGALYERGEIEYEPGDFAIDQLGMGIIIY